MISSERECLPITLPKQTWNPYILLVKKRTRTPLRRANEPSWWISCELEGKQFAGQSGAFKNARSFLGSLSNKGTLLGPPNREPQEYSRYIIGIYLPGSFYSIIFLLYSWGSLSGVPSRVPL